MSARAGCEGRVALVTGASRGVGRGIAELLAARGSAVAVNYRRDREAAEETVAAIVEAGGSAAAFAASVDRPEACQELVDAVVHTFGGLDLLVCNAGVASRGRSVADTDSDEVTRLMAVHAIGPHQLCRFALPHLRAGAARRRPDGRPGRGDVVFISSVATTLRSANAGPYTMAKAAMEALASTLANEERANGIHVNVVAPGLVETEMGRRLTRAWGVEDFSSLHADSPFGRVCQPLDVAEVVAWLCSDGAGYLTGQRIECDGGGRL